MDVQSSINQALLAAILISGCFLSLIALYPQYKLWNAPHQWEGNYAYNDIDEVAYSAYLRALIDGEPRRSDPYSGKYGEKGPSSESLFSIQFAAPYSIAIPARVFGIGAPLAMTLAGMIAAFLTAAMCCWLLYSISKSAIVACSGTLVVLCGGAFFAWEGAIGEVLGTGFPYPYFPFLRRYIPAVAFPALFGVLFSVWRLLNDDSKKSRVGWVVVGSLCFSFLVFSYFYLWTAVAGWLFCLTFLILIVQKDDWKEMALRLLILGGGCLVPLGFYTVMLASRSSTMDQVQLLVETRVFDLMRTPIFFGLGAIAFCLIATKFGELKIKSHLFVFTVSLGIVPVVLFNQQVVTGMSLQPIHYEVFVGNYLAGLSVVLSVFALVKQKDRQLNRFGVVLFSVLATVAVSWGVIEAHVTASVLDKANAMRDRTLGVSQVIEHDSNSSEPIRTVFSTSSVNADDLPTHISNDVLWARHQHVFPGLDRRENIRRYYLFLYYQGHDAKWLDWQLRNGNFVASIALFGWGRHTSRLSVDSRPLTVKEIRREVEKYRHFYEGFSKKDAENPKLGYLVTTPGNESKLTNLLRWYRVEKVGGPDELWVFRLTLKD